ncbi:MAG: oxidoreductase [Spirochaetes bacterium GWB1_36_13]|nr:MAG: oxidoreductase [Spirochaetes bacterium GWB1_36_13]
MNQFFIITGTSQGIGKELAEYYLDKGCKIAGADINNGSIKHENYIHYILDVSDEKKVSSMVKDVSKKFSQIDVLINNAGMASMNHFLLTPDKTAHKVFNTNFFGTFLFTRETAKIMMKKKYGRIVNFSTVAVSYKLEGEAVYAASKAAIENLTCVTAKELGEMGITVNAIGPTPVKTALIRNVPENKIQELIDRQAVKRFGEFRDIINVIDFFISEKSDLVTGQVVYLGGANA